MCVLKCLFLIIFGFVVLVVVIVVIFGLVFMEWWLNYLIGFVEGFVVLFEVDVLYCSLVIGDWYLDVLLWDCDILKWVDCGYIDIFCLIEGNVVVQVFMMVMKSLCGQNYSYNIVDVLDNIIFLFIGQFCLILSWFSLKECVLVQVVVLVCVVECVFDQLCIICLVQDLQELLDVWCNGVKIVGVIFGLEGVYLFEGDIVNLCVFYGVGFWLLGLMYFFDNELGGSLYGEGGMGLGLFVFGCEVVQEMQQCCMIIDLVYVSLQMVCDVLVMFGMKLILFYIGIYG